MKVTKQSSTKAFASMPTLVVTVTMAMLTVAVAVYSLHSAQGQQGGTADNKPIDLTGKWKTNDGLEVVIVKSGPDVKAKFVRPIEICPSGSVIDFYFVGSLTGNTLTGTMKRCTRDETLREDCKLTDPYEAKIIEATVAQNTITGQYVPDYLRYDKLEAGHYVNCVLVPGKGQPKPFELTRECGLNDARRQHFRSPDRCKPDHVKGCQDLAKLRTLYAKIVGEIVEKGDFSYKAMERLKEAVDPWLDILRGEFCDGPTSVIDKVSDDLVNLLCEGDQFKRMNLVDTLRTDSAALQSSLNLYCTPSRP